MPSSDSLSFPAALQSLRRRHLAGLAAAALPSGIAAGASVLIVAGVADTACGFEPAGLHAARILAAATALGCAGAILVPGLRRGRSHAADGADAAIGDSRRPVRTAHDLADLPPAPAGSLEAHLRSVAVREALAALATLPYTASLPMRALRRSAAAFASVALLLAHLSALAPTPLRVTASRLLSPDADLPPWTPWSFAVEPGDTEVFYGADSELVVRLSGEKPDGPVYCLIRNPDTGAVEKTRAFDRGDGSFGYRVEKAATPLEYAFSAGRGRSVRHRLGVRLQPRVAEASVRITPPAYSGLPEKSHALGARDLAALEGSVVTLTVRSNRPLSGGELRVTPVEPHRMRHRAVITPQSVSGDTLVFRWPLKATSRLSLTLRDLRGTPSDAPLEAEQKSLPDEAPEVTLTSPPARSLATADSTLLVSGDTRDDLGLDRITFLRTLTGYDDRSETVAAGLTGKERGMERSIDLSKLGVNEGNTLEFRLQAADRNPSGLGVSTTPPALVTIISHEQYAEILRDRTTVDEFRARFDELRSATDAAAKSLDALEQALASGDPAKIEQARVAAEQAHRESLAKLDAIRKDFAAFDLEKDLREQAYLASAALNANLSALKSLKPGAASRSTPAETLAAMRANLGRNEADRKKLAEDAERLAQIQPVMEMAGRFRHLYLEQNEILTELRKLADAPGTSESAHDELLRRQLRNRTALATFRKDFAERLRDLPQGDVDFDRVRAQAEAFLRALGEPDPGEAMGMSGKSLSRDRLASAVSWAETAKNQLEALMKKQDDDMASMCNGNCMKFQVSLPSARETMAQMLRSLCKKPGSGSGRPGFGSGSGEGSGPGSGESTDSLDNVPLFGPSRRSLAASGHRDASSAAGGAGTSGTTHASSVDTLRRADAAHDAVTLSPGDAARVPERHAEAVRRYFTPAEERPARRSVN